VNKPIPAASPVSRRDLAIAASAAEANPNADRTAASVGPGRTHFVSATSKQLSLTVQELRRMGDADCRCCDGILSAQ
jgi:hypothetical protein